MKTLYLIRHAEASLDTSGEDFDRALTEFGEQQAQQLGAQILEQEIQFDCIITSSAKRAITTAQLIAEAISYSPADIQTKPQIYNATVEDLLEIVHNFDEKLQNVMIIGHNAGISLLASQLQPDDVVLRTCGCEILKLPSWKEGTVVV